MTKTFNQLQHELIQESFGEVVGNQLPPAIADELHKFFGQISGSFQSCPTKLSEKLGYRLGFFGLEFTEPFPEAQKDEYDFTANLQWVASKLPIKDAKVHIKMQKVQGQQVDLRKDGAKLDYNVVVELIES